MLCFLRNELEGRRFVATCKKEKEEALTSQNTAAHCDSCGLDNALAPDNAAQPNGHDPLDPALPFFANRDCPYFPCHNGIDPSQFNCLFCFCPLYALGPSCGGQFSYTDSGVKDCSSCSLPHQGNNGNTLVSSRFRELAELAAKR